MVGRDNAYLSGLHLHQTVMGSVSYESSVFNFFKQDGIFGMALPSLSELTKGGRNTALINLFDTNPSVHRSFSFFLSDADREARGGHASKLIIGGIDESLPEQLSENMTWVFADVVPVQGRKGEDAYGFWLVSLIKVSYGNENLCAANGKSTKCLAIIDTGTSLISLPTTMFNSILENLSQRNIRCSQDGRGQWRCSARVHPGADGRLCLFVLSAAFAMQASDGKNGHNFVIDPKDYLKVNSGSGNLDLLLQPSSSTPLEGSDTFILGDVFLRKYYSLYILGESTDTLNPQVGFWAPADASFPHDPPNSFSTASSSDMPCTLALECW